MGRLKGEYYFSYNILGEGPLRERHQTQIKNLGLEDRVTMWGNISNPEDVLSNSDIFIHSSLGEGCSNAILEAMYMGLPVVVTDTGGTSEIVGTNAILFPYGDVLALEKALRMLLDSRDKRQKMGEESFRLALERFTINRMITDYERIIFAIAKGYMHSISDLRYAGGRKQ